jgi:hypothetical protein
MFITGPDVIKTVTGEDVTTALGALTPRPSPRRLCRRDTKTSCSVRYPVVPRIEQLEDPPGTRAPMTPSVGPRR